MSSLQYDGNVGDVLELADELARLDDRTPAGLEPDERDRYYRMAEHVRGLVATARAQGRDEGYTDGWNAALEDGAEP